MTDARAGEEAPETRVEALLAQGFEQAERGAYFTAHDCFEAAWRIAEGARRVRCHGLAQWMASYHQLGLGRGRAAVSTWHKAREKLTREGALSPELSAAVDALHARLGLSLEGPRHFDPERLRAEGSLPLASRVISPVK